MFFDHISIPCIRISIMKYCAATKHNFFVIREMLDRSIADLKLTILDLDKKFELLDQEESDWKAR